MAERLQKILSQAGVASRRASEQLIVDGRVTVNGTTIRELGSKADPADDIRVDGRRIRKATRQRYILLNKPRGYVTTRSDPERRRTVIELLERARAVTPHEYVYPVGRLDFDSEGLLLLTNDGDFAAHLTHPRHEVPRVYEAAVLGVPDAHDLERLARGIEIEGRRTGPAEVRLATQSLRSERESGGATLVITVKEGRNRQVRKMCEAIGHPVTTLRRVAIGSIRDHRLKPGQWRELTPDEVRRLLKPGSEVEPPSNREPRRYPRRPARDDSRPRHEIKTRTDGRTREHAKGRTRGGQRGADRKRR
jgi:23S rRNA pseudouridine2605 synthase